MKRRKVKSTLWKKYVPEAKLLIKKHINNIDPENSFFVYNKITVRNQKTRWGSCSSKGNLNFNYRIVDLPNELSKYLVIHELCHLKHMNHSKEYWALVKSFMPEYKKTQKLLKKTRITRK